MKKLEKVLVDKKVSALVFRKDFGEDGVNFLTEKGLPLQVGIHKNKSGRDTKSHIHDDFIKSMKLERHEVLYVIKGSATITFFKKSGQIKKTLKTGDGVLVMKVAHKVSFPPRSVVLEIKQGPHEE